MRTFLKVARVVSGFLVFAAIFFSFLFTFSLYNCFRIFKNRDCYYPATFEVVDAVFYPPSQDGDGFGSYWLTGAVENRPERFIPNFPAKFFPKNAEDLLAVYGRGTKVPVLYNPQETTTVIQGETLRVLPFASDFWSNEERRRNKLMGFVFLPVPLTLVVYLIIRRNHAGHLKAD
jgi:hypothetical protein